MFLVFGPLILLLAVHMWQASNVFGSRGPRKMKVHVGRVFPDGTRARFQPMNDRESILACYNRNETANIVTMVNKPPKWNDSVGAYVLNFNGRVTMASVKNFQLVTPEDRTSAWPWRFALSSRVLSPTGAFPHCPCPALLVW